MNQEGENKMYHKMKCQSCGAIFVDTLLANQCGACISMSALVAKRADYVRAIHGDHPLVPQRLVNFGSTYARQLCETAALLADESRVKRDVPLLGHNKADYHVQDLIDAQKRTMTRAQEILAVNHELQERIIALEARIAEMAGDDGDHPYHGPLGDDGVPASDVVHERFHKAVGDILSGNVMPKAREQMRDALNRPVPTKSTGTTTNKPLPRGAMGFTHQQIGIRLP